MSDYRNNHDEFVLALKAVLKHVYIGAIELPSG